VVKQEMFFMPNHMLSLSNRYRYYAKEIVQSLVWTSKQSAQVPIARALSLQKFLVDTRVSLIVAT
jgi:hypothetical protein